MKFRSLFGIAAVVGALFGAMSFMGGASAAYPPPAPAPCASSVLNPVGPVLVTPPYNCVDVAVSSPANPGAVLIGSPVTVTQTLTVNGLAFNGVNATLAFDPTVMGAATASNPVVTVDNHGAGNSLGMPGTILCLADPIVVLTAHVSIVGGSCAGSGPAVPVVPAEFATFAFPCAGIGAAALCSAAAVTGPTAFHMPEVVEGGASPQKTTSVTLSGPPVVAPENMAYTCSSVADGTVSNVTNGILCRVVSAPPPAPTEPFNSALINIVPPPPNLSATKTASCGSPPAPCSPSNPAIAGASPTNVSFTITVTNAATPPTPANNVKISDLVPIQFMGLTATPSQGTCAAIVGNLVSCNLGTIAAPGTASVTITVGSTDPTANGPVANCATVTNDHPLSSPLNNICATVNFVPPAVAWSKSPTSANVWLATCDPTNMSGQCVGQKVNTFTFDEIMTNQGDTAGLGGFSFDLHYDPTQFVNPTTTTPGLDLSPATAIFSAAHRTLDCTITIPLNGIIHVACASTGTFGSGPKWSGPKVMAHVTMTPQSAVVEAIRPNKENGDLSVVKDDQVTVTNTCGQPLNDESDPPPNIDCQGKLLQGVGGGGVLIGNPDGGEAAASLRRLEGDVNADCSVNVSDMQIEAAKFGLSVGNAGYQLFYDVNTPLQHGDGEIDINDVQFVYGRVGSECSAPIPAQPPLTPAP